MAVKLQDLKIEVRAIKTLTHDNEALRTLAFSKIRDESFSLPELQEAYARIKAYAKMGEIPLWENFIHDTRLSEDTYNLLAAQKVTEARNRADALYILQELDMFRQRRAIYDMSQDIYLSLHDPKNSIEDLMNEASERLANARITNSSETDLFSLGGKEGSKVFKKIFKNIMRGEGVEKIPTGMDAFDKVNGGVPIGSCFVIGAPSGEGKSALALNIGVNMASSGASVCVASLEMNESQTFSRYIAMLTAIPVIEIENSEHLSLAKQQKIERALDIHAASLRLTGGKLSFKVPSNDVSIEELLYGLKPFGYKVIIIDYLTLLKGMSGERAWEHIGEAVRLCKRLAELHRCIIIPVVQTDDDGDARFSKMIKDNASLMWTWGKVKVKEKGEKKVSHDQVETFDVIMGKTRNQVPVPLKIFRKFSLMQMTDIPHALNKAWIESVPHYDELEKLSARELARVGLKSKDDAILRYVKSKIGSVDFNRKCTRKNSWAPAYRARELARNRKKLVYNKNANPQKDEVRKGFSSKNGTIVLRGGVASSRR